MEKRMPNPGKPGPRGVGTSLRSASCAQRRMSNEEVALLRDPPSHFYFAKATKKPASEDRGYEGQVCENCRFSKGVRGLKEAALVCENKAGAPKKCIAVKEDEACGNFEYSRDVVAPEIARALAEGAKLIPLTQDKFAIVDAEDYERLSKYKWHALKDHRTYYARNRRTYGMVLMHREILSAPRGLVVDHINHNGLDNRKRNLRLCTAAENSQNARPRTHSNKTSKYKGVSFNKERKLFVAAINHNKKTYYLGGFKDETEAAKAYDKKAKELFGEFAYLNFPNK